ncbi:MAG: O-methyltransferase [Phycisphaerales bacterium]
MPLPEPHQPTWTAVDALCESMLHAPDPALAAALEESDRAGLPAIAVSPSQGKFLHLLARIRGAKRILELGTLGGYSTIWLARALPASGRLITLEIDPLRAEVARRNIERAGIAARVEIRIGPALTELDSMIANGEPAFDMVFIDADKPNNPAYVERVEKLVVPGSVVVVDNVIRHGEILDDSGTDDRTTGARRVLALLGSHPAFDAAALQTVGVKGYDGFALAIAR